MLVLTGLAHLGLTFALWAFPALEPDRRLNYYWLIGQLAGGVGMLLLLGIRSGSTFWYSTVPNTMVFLSMSSYLVVFRRFFQMPMGLLWWPLAFLVLIQLGLRSLGLADHLRLFWAVSGSVVIFSLVLHTLWQQRHSGFRLLPFLMVINSLIIVGLLMRATEALTANTDYSFLNAGLGQELGILALFVSAQANGVGFLLLMKERADHELVRLATLDPLTEVSNRRSFVQQAMQYLAVSDRIHHPVSFLLCDIDHFKQINDRHGHHAGDEVICALVKVTQQTLRAGDCFGRWGGEEFVIMLPHTPVTGAELFAKRLIDTYAAHATHHGGRTIHATVSIGVTEHRHGEDIQVTLNRADVALYRAKQNGRNRVERADDQAAVAAAASV